MALFQCIQLSKGTTPGPIKGWSGIWRLRAFWGLTPDQIGLGPGVMWGLQRCDLWSQRPLKQKKHEYGVNLRLKCIN